MDQDRISGFVGVLELIEHNPCLSLRTLNEKLQEAGLSRTELNDAFHSHLGIPAHEFLRQVRLERLHDELAAARPGELALDDAVRRWGFLYNSTFVQWYREQFGELPTQTLQR